MVQVVPRVQVTADVPEQLAKSLGVKQAALGNELRKAASFAWFKQRRLSKEDAANVAELSLHEFTLMDDESFLGEVWREFRPHARNLLVDSAITLALWLVLFGFEQLRNRLPISGWASEFIENIHSAGFVVVFAIFSILFTFDIFRVRKANP